MFDLDSYLARVGYDGARVPTLAVLRALMAAHVQTIPFENLDILLGRPIDLQADAVFDKLVRQRRGGYCFEQNGLFLHVLEALGFTVRPLSARVRIGRPREYVPPRTHLFIEVALDGEVWLTDVGVGALSLTAPIRLVADDEQETPHEPRRIVRDGDRWFHQARLADAWSDVCEFTGETMPPIDRELANWFTSGHPQSHFKTGLIVARAVPGGGRITLMDGQLKRRARGGDVEIHPITSAEELLALLTQHFGLHFPPGTRFLPGPAAA